MRPVKEIKGDGDDGVLLTYKSFQNNIEKNFWIINYDIRHRIERCGLYFLRRMIPAPAFPCPHHTYALFDSSSLPIVCM